MTSWECDWYEVLKLTIIGVHARHNYRVKGMLPVEFYALRVTHCKVLATSTWRRVLWMGSADLVHNRPDRNPICFLHKCQFPVCDSSVIMNYGAFCSLTKLLNEASQDWFIGLNDDAIKNCDNIYPIVMLVKGNLICVQCIIPDLFL